MSDLAAEALEVLELLRDYTDFDGDDEVNEELRWAYIEAARDLAEKVAGATEATVIADRQTRELVSWACKYCGTDDNENLVGRPFICRECGEVFDPKEV